MKFEYYFAQAILKILWHRGLLTEDEFERIDELLKRRFKNES